MATSGNKEYGLMKYGWQTILTANDASRGDEVGVLRFYHDNTYGLQIFRYVLTDTTLAAGDVVMFVSGYPGGHVTKTVASAKRNWVAGVANGVITATQYGWVQCGGRIALVTTDGNAVAAGDTIIMSGTDGVSGVVAAGTASTYKPLGIATAASSGSTVAANLCCAF